MTTVEIWLNGEHYVLDRDQWEDLTESVDGSVHALPDDELEDLLADAAAPTESTA